MSVSGQNLIDNYAFMKGRFSFVERNLGVAECFGDCSGMRQQVDLERKIKIKFSFILNWILRLFLGKKINL